MIALTPAPAGTEGRLTDDDALIAMATARVIARRLCRRGAIPRADVDDVAADLVLHAVRCWRKFNERRGSASTFISAIMSRAAISMLRARASTQRDFRRCKSLADITNGDDEIAAFSPWALAAVNRPKAADLHHDIEVAVAQLPLELRAYCALLMVMTEHEIVRLLKVSRYHVATRVREIRRCFEAAGLDEYL
ncbi:MAG TPA: sigma factor [Phycisphaerae bacterium]|nr:sigma factor [Phycisphaerae bacterium]